MTTTDAGAADLAARSHETSLPTQYRPAEVERPLYERWMARGYFRADAASEKEPFCIVIPPPNVTGVLHLGHALEQTMMDALVRRARMQRQGRAVAARHGPRRPSPPRLVVERDLAEREGLRSRATWAARSSSSASGTWKAGCPAARILGPDAADSATAVDWSRERFTMDEGLSRAVQTDVQAAL